MITVPQAVAEIIERPGRTFTAEIDFGNVQYSGITSMIRTATLAPNSAFAIGEAVSANIEIDTTDRLANVANHEFFASISIAGEDFPLGYYIAGKPVKSGKISHISAYDRMALAERFTYQSALTYPSTVAAVFEEIVHTIDSSYQITELASADNLTISEDKLSGFPCRDALAYLAAYIGANCAVDTDGKFKMIKYTDATSYELKDNTMESPDFADETTVISGLACTISNETMLTAGSTAKPLSFICPIMTQDRLNAILTQLSAAPLYQYSAAFANQLCGDPRIEIGDVITMIHDGETFTVPVMSLMTDFDGGLIVNIQSFDVTDTSGLTLAQKIDIAYRASQDTSKYAQETEVFTQAISNASGLHRTEVKEVDGSVKYYFHDKDTLAESTYIFTMTSNGFAWASGPNCWNNGNPVWTTGVSSAGRAILQALSAYNITADIIDTGELVIKDQQGNIIHKFSYDDYSAVIGGPNGISYNASTGKTTIGSNVDILGSVTIGGSATIGDTITNEVEKAVDDLDIKGIDHTEIKYASSASNTTAPTPESVWVDSPPNVAQGNYLWTRTVIYYSDNSKSNPSYSVARQGVNGVNGTNGADGQPGKDGSDGSSSYIHIRYSANSNGYPMTTTPNKYIGVRVDTSSTASTDYTKYTWSKFEGTDGAQGLPGTNGKDGTSEYIHLAYSTVGQGETHTDANSNVSWFSGAEYLGIYHDDQDSDPTTWSVYTWSRIKGEKGADGSDVDHYENAYAISTSGTQPPEDGYAVRYYWAAKYNNSGYEETMAEYFPVSTSSYYKNSSTDPYASNVGWDSTKLYLYSFVWHYTDYGNSLDGYLTDFEMCAVYNQSLPPTYPEVEQSTWHETPPDTSQYKGQYLWTRTTVYYTSGAEVVTYSVAYIGTDGTSGRGISSTAQYYYATATDTATLPAVGSTSWKNLPSQLSTPFSQSVPYLWSYTQTNYTSGNPDRTTPAIIGVWGQDGSGSGTQGRGISSITPQYALSTSNSTAPTSGWSETPPEYPSSAFTYTKSASRSISSGYSSVSLITGISIASGNTYTIKYQFSSAFSSSCTLRIYNDSGTAKQSYTIAANTASGEISYTANFNADNAEIGLEMNGSAFSYTAQIEGEPQRYYYWQRDKIVWTDGSADTYTRAVLSQGFNAAIYSANRLNTSFAEVELAGVKQVYMDAGHIYANSLTAYNVTAYEAFIKNLMANYVRVDGNIDVINGNIVVTEAATTTDSGGMTQTYLDNYCNQTYGKSYASLSPLVKPYAFMMAAATYMLSIASSEAESGKIMVKTNDEKLKCSLYPNALWFFDTDNQKYSYYGSSANVSGNMKVVGALTAGNIQKGTERVTVRTTTAPEAASDGFVTVSFDHEFDNIPVVVVTPVYNAVSPTNCYTATIKTVSTTGFSFGLYTPNFATTTGTNNVTCNWIAIS